eukprot:gb/GEZN01013885.1/.p1 GENE.gb/GEZN01013885.1/~~gb/GEZN01013885.1/.p1  ORF type:complete len:268 (+),score=83.93 gb/GEZN01013885.1/:63-806(+)
MSPLASTKHKQKHTKRTKEQQPKQPSPKRKTQQRKQQQSNKQQQPYQQQELLNQIQKQQQLNQQQQSKQEQKSEQQRLQPMQQQQQQRQQQQLQPTQRYQEEGMAWTISQGQGHQEDGMAITQGRQEEGMAITEEEKMAVPTGPAAQTAELADVREEKVKVMNKYEHQKNDLAKLKSEMLETEELERQEVLQELGPTSTARAAKVKRLEAKLDSAVKEIHAQSQFLESLSNECMFYTTALIQSQKRE